MIIAHRGESYLEPENTLSAINLAWEKGAKAVEIDIRLTADKEIVVIHDKNTKRIGNKNLTIATSTLQQIKTVDIVYKENNIGKIEKIPTLKEVLKTIPTNAKLIIEIKCGIEILEPLKALVTEFKGEHSQIEIICFDFLVLKNAKKVMPIYKMLWLLNLDYYLPHWFILINLKRLTQKLHSNSIDGVNVWAGKKISKLFVEKFTQQNLWVYTWTVNSPEQAKQLFNFGVHAVTTDKASWLHEQLNN